MYWWVMRMKGKMGQHSIQLIVQYYLCADPARQEEIDTCLRNNLTNPLISTIHLLTEEDFDFDQFPNANKIVQTVIGERLTFEAAFLYANAADPEGNLVWILSNADIYFDDTLRLVEWQNLDGVVYALTRHDVQADGTIKLVDASFAHGCQDVWIFRSPLPLNKMFTQFYLGIPGCDNRIAYELIQAGMVTLNPCLQITALHMDLASGVGLEEKTALYVASGNDESYQAGRVVPPPYQYFIFPSETLTPCVSNLFLENLKLNALASSVKNENLRLATDNEGLVKENSRLYAELASRDARIAFEQSQFTRVAHELKRQIGCYEQRVSALENSLSWRITSPVRRIANFLAIAAKERVSYPAAGNILSLDMFLKVVSDRISSGRTVLLVDFNLGGGSNIYSRELLAELERQGEHVVLLEYRFGRKDFHFEFNTGSEMAEAIFNDLDAEFFADYVRKLSVTHLLVSQLFSWPDIAGILTAITKSEVPYSVLVHDYFMICPNWALFDGRQRYCGVPDNLELCKDCLAGLNEQYVPLSQHTDSKVVSDWRQNAGAFLVEANNVICFSEASKRIFSQVYPFLENVLVLEHGVPENHLFTWNERSYSDDSLLTVGVIGHLGPHKGSMLVHRLINDPRVKDLPVRFVVVGEIVPHQEAADGPSGKIIVHGAYKRSELGSILAGYNVSIVMIPSLCPETFCFTASEAMLLGYPVLCCNIGAQADRVQYYNAGWIVNEPYFEGILKILTEIVNHPETVLLKSRNTAAYHPKTVSEHVTAMRAILKTN